MYLNFLQSENVALSILLKLSGSLTLSKFVHCAKLQAPIYLIPSGKFISCKFVQSEKQNSPIFLTPSGIVILSSALHS